MSDNRKTCLSCAFLGAAFVLPLLALAIGWAWTKDWKTGGIAMLATFGVLFLFSGGVLATIQRPSAFAAVLPFTGAMLYSLIPNPIPVPVDAVMALLAGSLFSFLLLMKRFPRLPKWLIVPMLLCAGFNVIGGFIPGPFDELIAYFVIWSMAAVKLAYDYGKQAPPISLEGAKAKARGVIDHVMGSLSAPEPDEPPEPVEEIAEEASIEELSLEE